MNKRTDIRADRRRREPGPTSGGERATSIGRLGRVLHHPATQAALIFSVLLFAYLVNGDILPGQDGTANVRLAGKLVSKGKLVFTPDDDPFMFEWQLKTPEGNRPATFRSWWSRHQGQPIRRAYERGDLFDPQPYYYLIPTRFPGVYADKYGLGAGLFAAPFVAAVYPFARDLYERPSASLLWYAAKVATASAVAGSAVFLFLAALAFVRPSTAAGLALAYGLGTCVWSASSQTLWQHGPTEFFLALGTFFLLRENRARSAPWVGLSYMLAFACRPTSALALAAAGVYYLARDRRAFLGFALGCLPVAVLLSIYNLHYFGRLLVLGQLSGEHEHAVLGAAAHAANTTPPARNIFGTSLLTGLAGILISPSRGLLVFSPAVGFAAWGIVRIWRDRAWWALREVSIAAAAMCLVVARWYGWWGGWCYGYRLIMDAVTLLAFLMIPVAEDIRRRRVLRITFAACLSWGIVVQVVGAFAYDVVGWNNRSFVEVTVPGSQPLRFADPNEANREAWARHGSTEEVHLDVNSRPGRHRIWSVRDNEILYYIQHFSEARSLKQMAIEQFLRDRG